VMKTCCFVRVYVLEVLSKIKGEMIFRFTMYSDIIVRYCFQKSVYWNMALKDAEARLRTVTGECRVVPDGEDVTEYDA